MSVILPRMVKPPGSVMSMPVLLGPTVMADAAVWVGV